MDRRTFLTGAAAVVATAALPPGGDGVALNAAAHPHDLMVDVFVGVDSRGQSCFERWPVSMLRLAREWDRNIGAVVFRDVKSPLLCGDMVALPGSGGSRRAGRRLWLESVGLE